MPTIWLLRACAATLVCLALPALGQQKPPALPEGPGKEQVAALCSGCHGLGRVMNSGYPQAYWSTVIRMMINVGVPIPPDQINLVTDYLAKNLPEKPRPDANIIPGAARISIKEWQVPIPGSRPHDPLATRDGAIWYTGQMTNRLGRVDPKTGQVKEFALKSPTTGPHGLVEDKEGNIFFTGNHQGLIGKLDPKTGDVTEYKMPDPNAKDPHSLSFAQDGMLFFTLQQSNMIGRLDPRTGDIRLVTSSTPQSRPYGILVNSKGVPHTVLFGTNKISRIDPKSMEIREYTLPDPAARPRRMAYDDNDLIYYTDYPRGTLGRLDPQSGKAIEWPSPGGPKSEPYGIVFTKGAVWYSESGTRPNTIVRFDPKTERFQSWAIPSGGYIVRKMDVNPDGNPVIATSTINGVGLVEVK
ncbi:MAG: cytochrome C [Betaproteobacteria bacterium]|nr:cytochrome C [Betaproteobacteria bacterium]